MHSAQYREYVIKSAKHLVASFSKEMQKEGTQLNHMHVNMAALLSLVSVWTKDSSLYRQSYLIFEAFLHQFEKETSNFDVYRDPNKLRNHSCPFTGYPFIMCLRNLQSTERVWNQMIRKWDLDRLQKRISEVVFVFCRPMQKGDHNQAMARTLGTAQALKYLHFVKHEHQQVWSNHVDETWEEWRAYEDTCENAPSYNAIYFWCLLMILDLYPNKLKYFMESKRAYSVFKRYRDQVSDKKNLPLYFKKY